VTMTAVSLLTARTRKTENIRLVAQVILSMQDNILRIVNYQIKMLHLDFEPRAAANADEAQMPLATMVRVYQLKDRQKVDTTALLAALAKNIEENICLLFGADAQPEKDFLVFEAKHENKLHSLSIHPQLVKFQHYGTWLMVKYNSEQLKGYVDSLPGCIAVIISIRYSPLLAL